MATALQDVPMIALEWEVQTEDSLGRGGTQGTFGNEVWRPQEKAKKGGGGRRDSAAQVPNGSSTEAKRMQSCKHHQEHTSVDTKWLFFVNTLKDKPTTPSKNETEKCPFLLRVCGWGWGQSGWVVSLPGSKEKEEEEKKSPFQCKKV